jgi:NAD+ synthase
VQLGGSAAPGVTPDRSKTFAAGAEPGTVAAEGSTAGVPPQIVGKKPTADLWAGQTDEGELGFSYALADKLLYAMVDERRSDDELKAAGFEAHFIEKVERMIRRNQFKRRPPVIAKVSHRTVNVDFRYPRDWGI